MPLMLRSASSTTGSSQCSRKCNFLLNGNCIAPPTTDSTANTTSGINITLGLSCGRKSPCAPCPSAASFQRASPKNTMMTWRGLAVIHIFDTGADTTYHQLRGWLIHAHLLESHSSVECCWNQPNDSSETPDLVTADATYECWFRDAGHCQLGPQLTS